MINKIHVSFAIVLLILGIILSLQFKTQQQIINSLAYQDSRDLITIYNGMREKADDLENTLQELNQRKNSLAIQAEEGVELAYDTQAEIEQYQILNGEVTVTGPGVTITLTRDTSILYYDLLDLLNELWVTGAEAISINDYRIMTNTYINQTRPAGIYINKELLLFPYVIKAIGDPHALKNGLTFPGGILATWKIYYNIHPIITSGDKLIIPPVKNPITDKASEI